jgi:hypothetical protein
VSIPIAHALLIGRQDLPIPQWLFAWGAAVVLVVSFVALTLLWTRAGFETDGWRPVPAGLSRLVVNPVTEALAGGVGVFLLGVVIWSGLEGSVVADTNFSLTFIFITFWLGTVLLSVLCGDVFRAFNPWRAIGRVYGGALRLMTRERWEPPLTYPERLGRWPAVVGILAFAWLELVYGVSGFSNVGLNPRTVAIAVAVYSAYTLVGMGLFGLEKWLQRGEAFSVYFAMFSRLAAVEVRAGRLGIRRPLAAASSWAVATGSIALVVTAIGITAFDGAQEGVLLDAIDGVFHGLHDIGLGAVAAHRLAETLFLAVAVCVIAGIYWAGVAGMRTVGGSPPPGALGQAFAHTLIPIALAYLVAHYFSYFVFGEQAQFTTLLSDPLGNGSDYFGTRSAGIDYNVLSANAIWYVQVGVLVCGHVIGLTLAHDRAITVYGDAERASKSQRWMLVVMVAFTCLGLFLLSRANA